MELHLSPELQARLDRIASQQGREAESLVCEAVARLVEHKDWFVEEVEKGLAQIQRGKLIEHEEVGNRLEKLLREKERRR